jgi:hypothetical protein
MRGWPSFSFLSYSDGCPAPCPSGFAGIGRGILYLGDDWKSDSANGSPSSLVSPRADARIAFAHSREMVVNVPSVPAFPRPRNAKGGAP